jgi:RNA polymerase sigma-70 factor (ECF subfamily)
MRTKYFGKALLEVRGRRGLRHKMEALHGALGDGMSGHFASGRQDDAASVIGVDALTTYRAALRTFVARRLPDPEAVEDLVQEACTRLLARARECPVQEPQAYLFRIAGNLLIDRNRRGQAIEAQMLPLEEDVASVAATQEDQRRFRDLQGQLAAALDELPSRCRDVFVLSRFDDMDNLAIAARLGISRRMVQKHLVRAVTHLYDRLGQYRGLPR